MTDWLQTNQWTPQGTSVWCREILPRCARYCIACELVNPGLREIARWRSREVSELTSVTIPLGMRSTARVKDTRRWPINWGAQNWRVSWCDTITHDGADELWYMAPRTTAGTHVLVNEAQLHTVLVRHCSFSIAPFGLIWDQVQQHQVARLSRVSWMIVKRVLYSGWISSRASWIRWTFLSTSRGRHVSTKRSGASSTRILWRSASTCYQKLSRRKMTSSSLANSWAHAWNLESHESSTNRKKIAELLRVNTSKSGEARIEFEGVRGSLEAREERHLLHNGRERRRRVVFPLLGERARTVLKYRLWSTLCMTGWCNSSQCSRARGSQRQQLKDSILVMKMRGQSWRSWQPSLNRSRSWWTRCSATRLRRWLWVTELSFRRVSWPHRCVDALFDNSMTSHIVSKMMLKVNPTLHHDGVEERDLGSEIRQDGDGFDVASLWYFSADFGF